MDALIPAFIAVLLAETGDRVQTQTHRLALSGARPRTLWMALVVAGLVTFGIAAIGGAILVDLINYRARSLFLGIALLTAGFPMLFRLSEPAILPHAASLTTILVRLVPAQIASASPFLIAALSARTAMPALAMTGGCAAMLLAAALPLLLRDEWPGPVPLKPLRHIAGVILIAVGLWTSLAALQVI